MVTAYKCKLSSAHPCVCRLICLNYVVPYLSVHLSYHLQAYFILVSLALSLAHSFHTCMIVGANVYIAEPQWSKHRLLEVCIMCASWPNHKNPELLNTGSPLAKEIKKAYA